LTRRVHDLHVPDLACVQGAHNTRFIKQLIQEIFGDTKLGDETVKSYSKMNHYFLTLTFEDFMIQLETCFQSLKIFTRYKGMASEGYWMAHRIILMQSIRYRPLFATNPLMEVKIK
jgi:hypothetical protein